MSVLALVTKSKEAASVVRWASGFAAARDTKLIVLCWKYSPVALEPGHRADGKEKDSADEIMIEVDRAIEMRERQQGQSHSLSADNIQVQQMLCPDATAGTLRQIEHEAAELVVAAAEDHSGRSGATYITNRLLRQSPCNTIILFGNRKLPDHDPHVMVYTADNNNDMAAVYLAAKIAEDGRTSVTMARMEDEPGDQAIAIGRNEIQQLMRDSGVNPNDQIQHFVFRPGDAAVNTAKINEQDLVLLGAGNQRDVQKILNLAETPTVAVIKRTPPLRSWNQRNRNSQWNPRLSPADYTELIQGLRRGSRLRVDFLVMLGLAAAIASLGLLQDSPAVVIGSMLLAPLMTPMICTGLALAQANPRLGRSSLLSVITGFLLTLAVSYIIAIVTPGEEMTAQVLARGAPNILDLLIALFSACAAAYALARPNLVGAVAGVAIATALVPPLCSAGISIAYREYLNAQGAGMLFLTNLVAIIIGAAMTFRYLGITPLHATIPQQRWVYRMLALLGVIILGLALPLQNALYRTIEQGKSQPAHYPLTHAVEEAVVQHIQRTPGVDLVVAGRPSSLHSESDVIIVVASSEQIPETFGDELADIVQHEMDDDELTVEVHCLQESWKTQRSKRSPVSTR